MSVSDAIFATEFREVKPVAVTLTVSFMVAPDHVFAKVTVAFFFVLVKVQTML